MGKYDKLKKQILQGTVDTNISFNDLCQLLSQLGFDERTRGSHPIFRRAGIEERINLQKEGSHAKPYQVRQVRYILLRYRLGGDE
ncbi:MAG: type II toxin-antitoxin system HicA family toxin [Candidatus Parabeggiatoa sp. nov. 2]|nr:MAG: type II toxin-antitoxin system HicA family toxin [Gammaproteobacteria bacterium]